MVAHFNECIIENTILDDLVTCKVEKDTEVLLVWHQIINEINFSN